MMRKSKNILLGLMALATLGSCTKNFDEINTDPQGFFADEVSAKYFLTNTQYKLYSPDRFPYWRAHLIHADRFAGHFTFGFSGGWWSEGLCYTYDIAYTDATYGWLAGYLGNLKGFTDFVKEGGELENEYMYAMALIMKGLYYQMYTETFGMVPYSEAGVEGILTPKYDTQQQIYKGVIAELDQAMAIIGSAERTGLGVNDAGANDLYCGGDLQKWKKMANTLKLRIGMRALGAAGDDFAADAIAEALAAPLLDEASGSVLMTKDFVISEWDAAAYGDVWHNFGGTGSKWKVGNTLVNMLLDTNDPRLAVYAEPVVGGSFVYTNDATTPDPNFQTRIDFITATLDAAGATYTVTVDGADTTLEVPGGQYIGLPTRANGDVLPYIRYDMFSAPGQMVTQQKGSQVKAYPEIVLTSAEAYFLQAEAVVRGLSGASGDAQELFAQGIREAMKIWEVPSGDVETYLANEDAADLTVGTMEEKLEKIAHQRWLVSYTDGFEAWAVVRDTGYPASLAAGVSDPVLYELGTLNGAYPQRLRYGSGAQDNPNFSAVEGVQGPNVQGTKLWFAQ